MPLLRGEAPVAGVAARACRNLAVENTPAVCSAGALPPLVALLAAGAGSEVARGAAAALRNLSKGDAGAVFAAGALPSLVSTLQGAVAGAPSSQLAADAAAALYWLGAGSASAVVGAGALPPLVSLLATGAESEAALTSAKTLRLLTREESAAVLDAVVRAELAAPRISAVPGLRARLREEARRQLELATLGADEQALRAALRAAYAVGLPVCSALTAAHERLHAPGFSGVPFPRSGRELDDPEAAAELSASEEEEEEEAGGESWRYSLSDDGTEFSIT